MVDDMGNDVSNGDDGGNNAGNNASKGDGGDAGGEEGGAPGGRCGGGGGGGSGSGGDCSGSGCILLGSFPFYCEEGDVSCPASEFIYIYFSFMLFMCFFPCLKQKVYCIGTEIPIRFFE